MITGIHTLIYSTDPEADRAFFRDVLEFDHVVAHDTWLIFALPPAELGIHPTNGEPQHELFLMCDDIAATTAELTAKGVSFTGPATDEGFGILTQIRLPGGGLLGLYQPKHATAV
jgi:predicted enzyme related to lactoylglutathione lyase